MTGGFSRFGRFQLVGALGVAVQLGATFGLMQCAGLRSAAATAVAVEIAVLHNFAWHERFTWRDRRQGSRAARLWRFHAANGAVSLIGNSALVYVFAERLSIAVLPSELLAIGMCGMANFGLVNAWVYRGNGALINSRR